VSWKRESIRESHLVFPDLQPFPVSLLVADEFLAIAGLKVNVFGGPRSTSVGRQGSVYLLRMLRFARMALRTAARTVQ